MTTKQKTKEKIEKEEEEEQPKQQKKKKTKTRLHSVPVNDKSASDVTSPASPCPHPLSGTPEKPDTLGFQTQWRTLSGIC